MKLPALLLLLAALSVDSHADTFEMRNKAGGKIVLTGRVVDTCTEGTRQMYSTTPAGQVLFGCWALVDEMIWVRYIDGAIRIHDPNDFVQKGDKSAVERPASSSRSKDM